MKNFLLLILLCSNIPLLLADECGSLKNHFGPFDYRLPKNQADLKLVEDFHFTGNVERLIKGESGTLIQDLNYTLRAFPNHHRALITISNYAQRKNLPQYYKFLGKLTLDCYFRRAMSFMPDDYAIYLIYGTHYYKTKQYERAEQLYLNSLKLSPQNAEIHYNLGLLYLKLGTLEQSLSYAKKAYELGIPLPGLRKLLTKKGIWENPK